MPLHMRQWQCLVQSARGETNHICITHYLDLLTLLLKNRWTSCQESQSLASVSHRHVLFPPDDEDDAITVLEHSDRCPPR